jgi:uncharacterized protein YjdB
VRTDATGKVCLWLPVPAAGKDAEVVLGAAGKIYGKRYTRGTLPKTDTLPSCTLTVSPSTIDFGKAVKTTSNDYAPVADRKITVKNESGINFINLTNSFTSNVFERKSNLPPDTLRPGGEFEIFVAPRASLPVKSYSETSQIMSMGIPVGNVTLKFDVVDSYALRVDPAEVDFGSRPVGEYGNLSLVQFRVTNTGTGTITNFDVTLTGAGAANFDIRRDISRSTLEPNQMTSLSLRPKTNMPVGAYAATLAVTSKEVGTIYAPVKFNVGGIALTGAKNGDKFIYRVGKSKTKQLRATVSPAPLSNERVTWKSSNTSIATVNASGLVTFKGGEGNVTITATASGNTAGSASVTLQSIRNVTSMSTPLSKVYIQRGKSMTLPVAFADSTSPTAEFQSKLKWKSSKASALSVTQSGKITASSGVSGTTTSTVTATSANGKTLRIKVTVLTKAVKLKSVSAKFPKSMKLGKTYQLNTKLNNAKATGVGISFSSSNKSVIKVSKAGKMFALKRGTAKITIKAGSKKYVKTVKVN